MKLRPIRFLFFLVNNCYLFPLGPALLLILNLESWKPALAETVQDAFDKAGYDHAKAQASVKRRVKDHEDAAPSRDDAAALFGRVDVSSNVTKELLDKLKKESDKGAWKRAAKPWTRSKPFVNLWAAPLPLSV
ncbi:hypothetical protein PsorP6_013868 [Peronosclerospora sorghi]|uniref:Uncharacterized protein n=1 Tax=Peronosclerospora sorghi TaxID=230839 RepID=A0ACC0VK20_9STRA|nr:hypothetical protein PsorP6_013868 [Peronosclerospora sorghi]